MKDGPGITPVFLFCQSILAYSSWLINGTSGIVPYLPSLFDPETYNSFSYISIFKWTFNNSLEIIFIFFLHLFNIRKILSVIFLVFIKMKFNNIWIFIFVFLILISCARNPLIFFNFYFLSLINIVLCSSGFICLYHSSNILYFSYFPWTYFLPFFLSSFQVDFGYVLTFAP